MDLRVQFIGEDLSGLFTMTDLTTQDGISRKPGYMWFERYEAEGPRALEDRSRRPHAHPAATEMPLVNALLAVRKRHPRWGAKKLPGDDSLGAVP